MNAAALIPAAGAFPTTPPIFMGHIGSCSANNPTSADPTTTPGAAPDQVYEVDLVDSYYLEGIHVVPYKITPPGLQLEGQTKPDISERPFQLQLFGRDSTDGAIKSMLTLTISGGVQWIPFPPYAALLPVNYIALSGDYLVITLILHGKLCSLDPSVTVAAELPCFTTAAEKEGRDSENTRDSRGSQSDKCQQFRAAYLGEIACTISDEHTRRDIENMNSFLATATLPEKGIPIERLTGKVSCISGCSRVMLEHAADLVAEVFAEFHPEGKTTVDVATMKVERLERIADKIEALWSSSVKEMPEKIDAAEVFKAVEEEMEQVQVAVGAEASGILATIITDSFDLLRTDLPSPYAALSTQEQSSFFHRCSVAMFNVCSAVLANEFTAADLIASGGLSILVYLLRQQPPLEESQLSSLLHVLWELLLDYTSALQFMEPVESATNPAEQQISSYQALLYILTNLQPGSSAILPCKRLLNWCAFIESMRDLYIFTYSVMTDMSRVSEAVSWRLSVQNSSVDEGNDDMENVSIIHEAVIIVDQIVTPLKAKLDSVQIAMKTSIADFDSLLDCHDKDDQYAQRISAKFYSAVAKSFYNSKLFAVLTTLTGFLELVHDLDSLTDWSALYSNRVAGHEATIRSSLLYLVSEIFRLPGIDMLFAISTKGVQQFFQLRALSIPLNAVIPVNEIAYYCTNIDLLESSMQRGKYLSDCHFLSSFAWNVWLTSYVFDQFDRLFSVLKFPFKTEVLDSLFAEEISGAYDLMKALLMISSAHAGKMVLARVACSYYYDELLGLTGFLCSEVLSSSLNDIGTLAFHLLEMCYVLSDPSSVALVKRKAISTSTVLKSVLTVVKLKETNTLSVDKDTSLTKRVQKLLLLLHVINPAFDFPKEMEEKNLENGKSGLEISKTDLIIANGNGDDGLSDNQRSLAKLIELLNEYSSMDRLLHSRDKAKLFLLFELTDNQPLSKTERRQLLGRLLNSLQVTGIWLKSCYACSSKSGNDMLSVKMRESLSGLSETEREKLEKYCNSSKKLVATAEIFVTQILRLLSVMHKLLLESPLLPAFDRMGSGLIDTYLIVDTIVGRKHPSRLSSTARQAACTVVSILRRYCTILAQLSDLKGEESTTKQLESGIQQMVCIIGDKLLATPWYQQSCTALIDDMMTNFSAVKIFHSSTGLQFENQDLADNSNLDDLVHKMKQVDFAAQKYLENLINLGESCDKSVSTSIESLLAKRSYDSIKDEVPNSLLGAIIDGDFGLKFILSLAALSPSQLVNNSCLSVYQKLCTSTFGSMNICSSWMSIGLVSLFKQMLLLFLKATDSRLENVLLQMLQFIEFICSNTVGCLNIVKAGVLEPLFISLHAEVESVALFGLQALSTVYNTLLKLGTNLRNSIDTDLALNAGSTNSTNQLLELSLRWILDIMGEGLAKIVPTLMKNFQNQSGIAVIKTAILLVSQFSTPLMKKFLNNLARVGDGFTLEFMAVKVWLAFDDDFQQLHEATDYLKALQSEEKEHLYERKQLGELLSISHSSFGTSVLTLRIIMGILVEAYEGGWLTLSTLSKATRAAVADPRKVVLKFQRMYTMWGTWIVESTSERERYLPLDKASSIEEFDEYSISENSLFSIRHALINSSLKSLIESMTKVSRYLLEKKEVDVDMLIDERDPIHNVEPIDFANLFSKSYAIYGQLMQQYFNDSTFSMRLGYIDVFHTNGIHQEIHRLVLRDRSIQSSVFHEGAAVIYMSELLQHLDWAVEAQKKKKAKILPDTSAMVLPTAIIPPTFRPPPVAPASAFNNLNMGAMPPRMPAGPRSFQTANNFRGYQGRGGGRGGFARGGYPRGLPANNNFGQPRPMVNNQYGGPRGSYPGPPQPPRPQFLQKM